MLNILAVGAVLNSEWKGGEPLLARLIINGLRKRGHEIHEIGYVRRGLDYALSKKPVNYRFVNYYENTIKLLKPDIILSFYDYDCSICLAAYKMRIPIVVSINIWWPICPRLTLYIDHKGNREGPNPIKCLLCRSAPEYPSCCLSFT
jgi:hypothetical protein